MIQRRVLPPNMRGVGDIRRAPMPPVPQYTPMPPTQRGVSGQLGANVPADAYTSGAYKAGGLGVQDVPADAYTSGSADSVGMAKPWDGYGSEGSGGFTGKAGSDSMTIEPDGMGNWSVDGGKMMPAGDAMTSAGGWMSAPPPDYGTPMDAGANGGESVEMPAAKPMSTPVSAGQGGIQGPNAGSTYDMGQLGMMG